MANVTPIKVNKNALLKAKILDATRRALLAQRINHMGTQTEHPFSTTMLMREKQTDIQSDLIGLTDASMETDGAVTLRQECPGGCNIAAAYIAGGARVARARFDLPNQCVVVVLFQLSLPRPLVK